MATKDIRDVLQAKRQEAKRQKPGGEPWLPEWQLWVHTEGALTERPLNSVLSEFGHPPVIDWSLRHSRGLPGLQSAVVLSPEGEPRWDQFVFVSDGRPRGVVIVPWRVQGGVTEIGLQREFRPAAPFEGGRGRWFTALPRGFVDAGEEALAAAERELREEQPSLRVRSIEQLEEVYSDTAYGSGPNVVVAVETVASKEPHRAAGDEVIEQVGFRSVDAALADPEMKDALSLAALAIFIGWRGIARTST